MKHINDFIFFVFDYDFLQCITDKSVNNSLQQVVACLKLFVQVFS